MAHQAIVSEYEALTDYYFALSDMMDQVLHDRHWAQTVAFDLESAICSAGKELGEVLLTNMHRDEELLAIFRNDFDRTMEFVKKLSRPKEVPEEERKNLLFQANAHRAYLDIQLASYRGILARLSRGT